VSELIIRDCYERNTVTIEPEAGVAALQKVFEKSRIPSLLVVDKKKKEFIGILHYEDLFGKEMETKKETIKAKDLAKNKQFFIFEDDVLEDVSSLLMETHEGIVPVLNSDLEYCGTISVFEILELFNEMLSSERDAVSFSIELEDKPGNLRDLIFAFSEENLNIISIIAYPNKKDSRNVFIKLDTDDVNLVRSILESNRLKADYIKKRLGT
jgi:acetoin utilization protein AcuB